MALLGLGERVLVFPATGARSVSRGVITAVLSPVPGMVSPQYLVRLDGDAGNSGPYWNVMPERAA